MRGAAQAAWLLLPLGATAASPEAPQPYPARLLRMIVATSAGTASDYFARDIGEQLASLYLRQVVFDNRPGAAGLIGGGLIAYARSRPGEFDYASVGIDSSSHMAAELFTRSTGLKVVHVPNDAQRGLSNVPTMAEPGYRMRASKTGRAWWRLQVRDAGSCSS